ncbi:MAG: UTRA domain-containing protein [Streptomyces sp.]
MPRASNDHLGPAPRDVTFLLGVEPGEDVLIRDRIMGDVAVGEAMQLATSFLPAALARGARLAERATGPGGVYDLLEDMGHHALACEESVGARMPTPAEAGRLGLPKGIPLLRIVRTTTGPDGTVLEVNDTLMSADAFEVGYSVTRPPPPNCPAEPTTSVLADVDQGGVSVLDASPGTEARDSAALSGAAGPDGRNRG